MAKLGLLILPLLLSAVPAFADTAAQPREIGKPAEIPFVDHDGIYNFQADGDSAVYLEDQAHRWYHATLMGPCLDLEFANAIGVKTRGTTSLDKFGALLVRGQECQISDLVTSDAPPKKAKKKS